MASKSKGKTVAKSAQAKEKPQTLSYGVVSQAGNLEGYIEQQPQIDVRDSTTFDYDDSMLVMTTQPSQISGSTLRDVPDNWSECIVTGAVKRLILSTPGYPKPIPRPEHARVNYEIRNSPGKGLGMFATRNLQAGELVVSERPLMVTPIGIRGGTGRYPSHFTDEQKRQAMMHEWEKVLRLCFERMPPENKEAFMELYNSHQHDGSGPILGVIRTNGYGLKGMKDSEGPEGAYSGVGKLASRINHSCRPNTTRHWDMPSFSLGIYAVCDIKKGEELTTQYCEVMSTTRARQRYLAPYGVQCTCSSCQNPEVSDERRSKIATFGIPQARVLKWMKNPRMGEKVVIDELLENLALIESEGLEAAYHYMLTLRAVLDVYVALADEGNAVRYGKRLGQWFMAEYGNDGLYKRYEKAESHRADKNWGIRKREKK